MTNKTHAVTPMNKSNLKSYAPQARKDFIAAVTARANLLGLSDKAGTLEVASAQTQGDVTVIAGQAWPAKVSGQRDQLIERIRKDGLNQTMEAVAYTWFNRFAALRYMELHDYLGHGHRALSSTSGGLPDILTHATDLTNELPGLSAAKVTELKLAGNRDGELYRMLLVAQCNALSRAMPFLFERIDDDSELLLPDNLLRSDSVIAKLVAEIPEEDWTEVEIIGWLYQFYISEKKDQVIGKVVKSEDIPAATQLFTPNWIVQYLVQNSVGRLWLMANPQSTLAKEWPYYITPAEQTPEVQAQLDALIQTRVREDGDTLNPESITVLDPACGSGHILVVAYDVLKAIYLERGYQPRAIPRLILEKNLYGLDIDDRAAQMAGFALLMKARADDRRLFTATDDSGNLQPPKLNVLSLQTSNGLSVDELATHLAPFKVQRATITALLETFEHAKTFGSLIQIPYALKTHLAVLPEVLARVNQSGDMYASAAADDLLPLVQQAQVLAMQFDAVVANPPYLGRKSMTSPFKDFAGEYYRSEKADAFAMFMSRCQDLCNRSGRIGMMTPFVWMFLGSYEEVRVQLSQIKSITSLVQPQYHTFFESAAVPICVFVIDNSGIEVRGNYFDLTEEYGADLQPIRFRAALADNSVGYRHLRNCRNFSAIPGNPIAFEATDSVREVFSKNKGIGDSYDVRQGMATSNNGKFVRFWFEVEISKVERNASSASDAKDSGKKWFPFNKGGDYRKWYGNLEHIVNWENDGEQIKKNILFQYPYLKTPEFVAKNPQYYFRESVSWTAISSSNFSCRYYPNGVIFSHAGMAAFSKELDLHFALAFLNSSLVSHLLKLLSPTLNFGAGDIAKLPLVAGSREDLSILGAKCVELSKRDWDCREMSLDFSGSRLVVHGLPKLSRSWEHFQRMSESSIDEMRCHEIDVNRAILEAYELQDVLDSDVSLEQITLFRADREKDCQRLISYAIGCMMGRYSLDEPGLIYAHAGNVGFEPGRYATFPADADGIVPITDELWFEDDAPSRIREFLRAVWGPDTLEENMAWLAESLGTKASETPDETIRRYIADKFFKDHLQTYKKRPIYWLFSSGKQGAFQALVYLHRYHEGTLARLRAEYVVPLTGKIQSRIEMLQKDALAASSTAARNKLAKEVEKLKKKHVELLAYDEQLRHYADMRITLDLDDGVKVNYGKFGDLLESVKAVTGGKDEE
ncbi:MAG: BREX-1 system adenine-specific DNA-methyltransferase PglX [Rhodoferax sp.]